MAISAQDVKKLRDATGIGFGDCKKALEESGGDFDGAIKLLRERGAIKSAKMAGREAKEGLLAAAVSDDGKTGSVVEMNCETDFVAKNDSFKSFVAELAVRGLDHADGELAAAAEEDRQAKIHELGENMVVGGNTRYVVEGDGKVATYIHPPGKIGVMVEFKGTPGDSFDAVAKGVCMHIAANSPRFLAPGDVDEETVNSEKEIYAKQMEGKPADLIEKILGGKMKKFFSEICLVEQDYVMDTDKTVGEIVKTAGDVEIVRFLRLQIGA